LHNYFSFTNPSDNSVDSWVSPVVSVETVGFPVQTTEEANHATHTQFMKPLIALLTSSLGKKFLMAITGAVLSLFVLGHMAGNLQIFLDPYFINSYAYKLQHLPYGLLWVVRVVLLSTVLIHVWVSVVLTIENRRARPEEYRAKATAAASYASRTMRVSGVIVFLFILFHLAHFTTRHVPGQEFNDKIVDASGTEHHLHVLLKTPDGKVVVDKYGAPKEVHNTHAMMISGFSYWWVSAIYIVAMFLLSRHLSHGVSSMFQSVGLRNSFIRPCLDRVAQLYGIVVFLGYVSIPVAVLTGLLHI
jgi:succinate dehydrogenase / fumarate reductase, cytochrome b subunit